MLLQDWMSLMEQIAPNELAADFDNVGLVIGTDREEIRSVLVALDCTAAVAEEAVERDVDLVLTHHPLFFEGVKRILPGDPDTAAAYTLIRHGIGLFSAHTNLDAAQGCVNDVLCRLLGLAEVEPLPPDGLGRIGRVQGMTGLFDFSRRTARLLGAQVRFTGDPQSIVRRVCVVGGSWNAGVQQAAVCGADTYVTGELKHDAAIRAQHLGVNCVVAGHYESEAVVLQPLIERLQSLGNGVQYQLALAGRSPFLSA